MQSLAFITLISGVQGSHAKKTDKTQSRLHIFKFRHPPCILKVALYRHWLRAAPHLEGYGEFKVEFPFTVVSFSPEAFYSGMKMVDETKTPTGTT